MKKEWFFQPLERLLIGLGDRLGYQVEPRYSARCKRPIPPRSKIHVGCGDQQLEGYVNCDLRSLPHVDLVCRAWEVSQFARDVSEIYSRHMLEHLTYAESLLTLCDWHRALGENGQLRIEVPNLRFAIDQWLRAEWSDEALSHRFSDGRWGFANFFGWQRECDPTAEDYNQAYWDVHKSGYDEPLMRYLLSKAGFAEIEIGFASFTPEQIRRRKLSPHASEGCHLVAVARKSSQRAIAA